MFFKVLHDTQWDKHLKKKGRLEKTTYQVIVSDIFSRMNSVFNSYNIRLNKIGYYNKFYNENYVMSFVILIFRFFRSDKQ